MSLVNDDINQLDAITNNQVKILAIYFYGYLKGKGYHADCYDGMIKKIHFYDDKNDKNIQTARYGFIHDDNHILFYFRKRSELTELEMEQLEKDFGIDFKPEPNKGDDKAHITIKTPDKAKLLTDKYIKAS